MTFRLVHARYSLPEWQAVKLTFFAHCNGLGRDVGSHVFCWCQQMYRLISVAFFGGCDRVWDNSWLSQPLQSFGQSTVDHYFAYRLLTVHRHITDTSVDCRLTCWSVILTDSQQTLNWRSVNIVTNMLTDRQPRCLPIQSTPCKMDTFGTGSKCPSWRDVHLIESQIKGVKKGRDQL